jgi:hypothetical protein
MTDPQSEIEALKARNARLVEGLERIAQGEVSDFCEASGEHVLVPLSGEEAAEIARATLQEKPE